jgi:hypothetical protein
MPEDLMNYMTEQQLVDVVEYLAALRPARAQRTESAWESRVAESAAIPARATFYLQSLQYKQNSSPLLQGQATIDQFAAYTLLERQPGLEQPHLHIVPSSEPERSGKPQYRAIGN